MRRIFVLLIVLSLLIFVVGCGNDDIKDVSDDVVVDEAVEAVDTVEDEATDKEIDVSVDNEVESKPDVDYGAGFDEILSTNDLVEIKSFIDDNIQYVDTELADLMVDTLVKLLNEDSIDETNKYFTRDDYTLHQNLNEAGMSDDYSYNHIFGFLGTEKYNVLDSLQVEADRLLVKNTFDKGFGLFSAEGSYYPLVDYIEINEKYSEYTSVVLQEYLVFASTELESPLTVEEYLAISVDELYERVLLYEDFLINNPDSKYKEDVLRNFSVALYKLSTPNVFDGMLEDDFTIGDDLKDVYQKLASDDSHPVSQMVAKDVIEFEEGKDGVLGSWENMDDLFNHGLELHNKALELMRNKY